MMNEKTEISMRERQIILLMSQGHSNQAISNETGKSVNTIKYHLKNIYKKLGAKNRIEAINNFNKTFNNL
jgi:LuxR family maltose regulon positive regulatory protein